MSYLLYNKGHQCEAVDWQEGQYHPQNTTVHCFDLLYWKKKQQKQTDMCLSNLSPHLLHNSQHFSLSHLSLWGSCLGQHVASLGPVLPVTPQHSDRSHCRFPEANWCGDMLRSDCICPDILSAAGECGSFPWMKTTRISRVDLGIPYEPRMECQHQILPFWRLSRVAVISNFQCFSNCLGWTNATD